jgi:hypothetical protein
MIPPFPKCFLRLSSYLAISVPNILPLPKNKTGVPVIGILQKNTLKTKGYFVQSGAGEGIAIGKAPCPLFRRMHFFRHKRPSGVAIR